MTVENLHLRKVIILPTTNSKLTNIWSRYQNSYTGKNEKSLINIS